MDDLARFAIGWGVLLIGVALVAFRRDIARWIMAHVLARAIRHLCRSDLHVV